MLQRNWVEIPIQLPLRLQTWVRDNIAADRVISIPPARTILFHGFDSKHYHDIQQEVDLFHIQPSDYCCTVPQKRPHLEMYESFVPVHSSRLQELFWRLYNKYPNQMLLREDQFYPQVTLCYEKL